MLGLMRLILDREEGSASGEDDFFSVARTMPLVAGSPVSLWGRSNVVWAASCPGGCY